MNRRRHRESARHDEQEPGHQMSRAGLSEPDFMARQRYLENSSVRDTMVSDHSMMVASSQPRMLSSVELHKYLKEQREIINNFRSQPWPMQMKIAALVMYKENLAKYAGQLNTIDTFRDSVVVATRVFHKRLQNFKSSLAIWNYIIKRIEGQFGSSVASFFKFLRWLCALNLTMSIIVILFLVIPQVIGGHGLQIPPQVKENGSPLSFVVDGKGYVLEYSVLFQGYYDSGKNEPYNAPPQNPYPEIGIGYKLPLAFLGVVAGIFLVCILAILLRMAEKYKFLQKASISEHYLFAWKVFASWDFTITSKETATYKRNHLTTSFKETIVEAESNAKTTLWRFILIRIAVHIGLFLLLSASGYTIYVAVENIDYSLMSVSFNEAITSGWQGLWLFIQSFQVQAVIVIRNFLFPFIFRLAEFLERHHPRTALKLMLVRLFVLYITSLYVLIIALFTFNRQCVINFDNTSLSANETATDSQNFCCWETTIGQELYKLSFTHLFAELVSIGFSDVFRWIAVKSFMCPRLTDKFDLAEFNLAENILKLVYGQALVWFGVLFCPFLPVINFFKNVFLFYVRAAVVSLFNRPPQTLFRIASTKTFYMALLLLNAFLCIFPVSYAVIYEVPSILCGPFRGLPSMSHIVTYEIKNWPLVLQTIISYIDTPTVALPFIGLLCIIILYFASLANALKEVNKDLRLQLHVELKAARDRLYKDAMKIKAQENKSEKLSSTSSFIKRRERLQKQLHTELSQHFSKTKKYVSESFEVQNSLENISSPGDISQDSHTRHTSTLQRIQASIATGNDDDLMPVTVSSFISPGETAASKGARLPQRINYSLPAPQITIGFVDHIHEQPRHS